MNFQVNIPCPEVSEMLQKIAFKAGFGWQDTGKQEFYDINAETLFFWEERSPPEISHGYSKRGETVSIEEAIKRLTVNKVQIGDYTGEISTDGKCLRIQCQNVYFEKVEEIYNLMKKLQ